MISAILLTKNEAEDLPACLNALEWCDDIHVVDSGSTDETLAVASRFGAKTYSHAFEGFGSQRNWALDHCTLKYDWILFLDADEVCTPEFREALRMAVKGASADTAGFYCCWKLIFFGRWLKRADAFPRWQFRVPRKGRARFVDFGHGQKESEVAGKIDYIREPYLHFAFSKGLSPWITRHNRYSDQEARTRLEEKARSGDLFSRHASARNKAIKLLIGRWPLWPVARFAWPYFGKLGFLDGWPGFVYCVNMAYYEFLIQQKMVELENASDFKTALGGRRHWREIVPSLLCGVAIIAALFFTLRPGNHGQRAQGIPNTIGYWLNEHDQLANTLGFLVLSVISFSAKLWSSSPRDRTIFALVPRAFLLGFFALMIEVIQLWIPGRYCDWRDILMGWGGIFVAFALFVPFLRRD
jgi:glycosyltransferase involved in cell wall biosynthesis